MLNVLITHQAEQWTTDVRRLVAAVELIVRDHGFTEGEISIAIVEDLQIHALNREYLDHDWPTDVISFQFDAEPPVLNGEVIVSVEMAYRLAEEQKWSGDDELLLYVIHGVLHLVGMDDQDDASAGEMRLAEKHYLEHFQVPFASDHFFHKGTEP